MTLTSVGAGFQLSGFGRNYSSAQCWEQMPGLATRSRSAGKSAIQTTCSMPPGDPRRATVITTWYPRGETITFDETGQYQFTLSGSNCTASVRRSRTLTRVKSATPSSSKTHATVSSPSAGSAAPPQSPRVVVPSSQPSNQATAINAAPPPLPEQAAHCRAPGPPVRLEVTPRHKLMRPGEKFQFSAIARDKNGCRAPVLTSWKLIRGEGAELSSNGTLTVPEGAHGATLQIQATVAQQSVTVTANVVSGQEFEDLLSAGSYGVLGESLDAAEVNLASGHVELEELGANEKSNKLPLLWLFMALLGIAGVAIYVLIRRQHTHKEVTVPTSARRSSDSTFTEGVEPGAETLLERDPQSPTADPQQFKRLCPVCGTRYEPGTQFCAQDGARLMRVN